MLSVPVKPRSEVATPGLSWVVGLACCLLLPGCQPSADAAPEIRLDWFVQPDPPRTGTVTLAMTLTDSKSEEPVEGAQVRIEGNMAHAGMQPVFATARESAPGRYEAAMDLTMGGDWFLLVDAVLPDGRKLHRQLEMPGVRAE